MGVVQWQLEQLEDVQLPQPEEASDETVLPPLEKPKREMHFRTRLFPHFSHRGNGDAELGKIASKL